jgi:hypothetical protein
MLACLLLIAAIQAEPDTIPAETIYATLQKTTPKEKYTYGGPAPRSTPGKTYTLSELTRKFGQPNDRQSLRGKHPTDTLTWNRQDGDAQATFSVVGYANPSKPETIRLRIISTTFQRK